MKTIKSVFLSRTLGILPILVLLFVIFSIIEPRIASERNIITIFRNASMNMVLACGMTMVIITGGIDLSVGSVLAVAAVVGLAVSKGDASYLSIPVCLGVGIVSGLINGLLVACIGLPPFIATLGTMTALRGAAYLLANNGQTIVNNQLSYSWLGNDSLWKVPYLVIVALLVIAIIHFILRRTTFGLRVYAVGGNLQAVKLTGIKVRSTLVIVYTIAGLLCGVVAVMLASRLMSANGMMGISYEMDVIAASVLGGTSMSGGVGPVVGTMFGALMIAVLNNALTIMNISSFWQMVIKGLVIIVAVTVDIFRNKMRGEIRDNRFQEAYHVFRNRLRHTRHKGPDLQPGYGSRAGDRPRAARNNSQRQRPPRTAAFVVDRRHDYRCPESGGSRRDQSGRHQGDRLFRPTTRPGHAGR